MSNETTPAVQRGGEAFAEAWDARVAEIGLDVEVDPIEFTTAVFREGMVAALSDPDDPDALARTLFQIHLASDPNLIPGEESLELWPLMSEGSRVHWRAVADGLRTTLLGGAS